MKKAVKQLIEQLKLDPTMLEQVDMEIEHGFDSTTMILNEFADPSQFAHVFEALEARIFAKRAYFHSKEIC